MENFASGFGDISIAAADAAATDDDNDDDDGSRNHTGSNSRGNKHSIYPHLIVFFLNFQFSFR